MRKIQFILGMLAVASSSATLAYDGTINFTGKVVAQTCSVTTGSKNLTVTLPTVSSNSLTSNGEVAGLTLSQFHWKAVPVLLQQVLRM